MTFGRNNQDSRIEFACFSFHVGLLIINFSSFKPDTENNANFDAVSNMLYHRKKLTTDISQRSTL